MTNGLKQDILNLLAKEFEYTQALHSEIEDIIQKLGLEDNTNIDETLKNLQQEGLIHLWIDHRGKIKLAKITVLGLNQYGDVSLNYSLEVK
ncbi:MAG: hypothetical protein ACXAC8_05505 [Candidatus Hodarchaeales archaeon]